MRARKKRRIGTANRNATRARNAGSVATRRVAPRFQRHARPRGPTDGGLELARVCGVCGEAGTPLAH